MARNKFEVSRQQLLTAYQQQQELSRQKNPSEHAVTQAQTRYVRAQVTARKRAPKIAAFQPKETVTRLLNAGARRGAVRFVCSVSNPTAPPELWEVNDCQRQGYVFELRDARGSCVETLPNFDSKLYGPLLRASHAGYPIDALGTVTSTVTGARSRRRTEPRLALHKVRRLNSALAAIAAAPDEIRQAEATFAEYVDKRDGLLRYIIRELRDVRGVVSKGLSIEFRMAEAAAVLQAVSTGQLKHASPRIHILLVGPPGVGKKIVSYYVQVLEPIALTAQASSLTRAGLATGAKRRKGRLVAEPGLLPQAHLGAVLIEDLHGLTPKARNEIFAVLRQVMEDGMVNLATIAKARFRAETALYFDLNRKSHLKGDSSLGKGGPAKILSDFGLTVELLTRIDAIFVIPDGSTSAFDTAIEMLGCNQVPDRERHKRERALQVLAALVRDKVPEVDLTEIESDIKRTMQQKKKVMKGWSTPDLAVESFAPRMSNSLKKTIAASARLHGRTVASERDADIAFKVLRPKIRFVKQLATSPKEDLSTPQKRHEAYWCTFGKEVVTPKRVIELFDLPRRTVMRDLETMAKKIARGQYRLRQPDSHRQV